MMKHKGQHTHDSGERELSPRGPGENFMPEHKGPRTHDETKLLSEGPGENNRENSTENFMISTKVSTHTTAANESRLPEDQERTKERTSCPSTKGRRHTTKPNCFAKGQERTTERRAQRTS